MHEWDSIVIGSGIGGLAAAAALGRIGRRVLVLEQHTVAGGQTQTFRRHDWEFATGVHYIGGVGPDPGPEGQFGRLLGWLSDGALQFVPCANPYDIVRLPGFEFGIEHPEAAYRAALEARFPACRDAIDGWFRACDEARQAAMTLILLHGLPRWMAAGLRLLRGEAAERWARRTIADELARIPEPRLRAVLGARWGDHGGVPATAPFLEHALVTSAYNAGAWYPVGGPARFVATLQPAIEAAGGALRTGADVKRILVEGGRVAGVEVEQGGERRAERSRHVISAMGVTNTVGCLDAAVAGAWQATVRGLEPGPGLLSLYIGLDGDVAAAGATSANHWICASDAVGTLWRAPADEDPPALFVTFPTQKDPSSRSAPTAEVVAIVDPAAFAPFLADPRGAESEAYRAFKERIAARLLAQFGRHFPALAPLVRLHELATPLTQRRYTRTPDGSMYGLEMSADRLTSDALAIRTPLPGLLLAGQDVSGPGIPAACMSGLMAAATVDARVWRRLRA